MEKIHALLVNYWRGLQRFTANVETGGAAKEAAFVPLRAATGL
jgi:hypothetical protein